MSFPASASAPGLDRRVPVRILTGFLGAGKTTLLQRILRDPAMARTAVLINEFGEVALDHHLIDRVDEHIAVLASGCICCSIQGDLLRALRALFHRALRRETGALERVFIETTGLADPAPIIHTLRRGFFVAERFRCDGVITVVDASHGLGQLDRHREALRQVAMADRLLLSKCELADAPTRAALRRRLRQLNPAAPLLEIAAGQAGPEALAACGLYDSAGTLPDDAAAWLGEPGLRAQPAPDRSGPSPWRHAPAAAAAAMPAHHDAQVRSFVLACERPLHWPGFSAALERLLALHGERLLRIKGLVNVAGDPAPRIVHCVGHVAYPPASLPAWPESGPCADRRSRLVFIVHALAQEEVERLLGGFCARAPLAGR